MEVLNFFLCFYLTLFIIEISLKFINISTSAHYTLSQLYDTVLSTFKHEAGISQRHGWGYIGTNASLGFGII